jgi:ribosomal protection tetracycline resistance protein
LLRRTLNLGILAHVDAGKTTLTERLLYLAGVIDAVGSVDAGTTQTDSLALEQQRGITIKAAVVSFAIGDVTVNLIDTPGHPDFIAEVERALAVLDGVVLVISAVEGVQPQTRILMRALDRLRLPTLMFVNKVDRVGADYERVVEEIRRKLTSAVVPMSSVVREGTPEAAVMTRGDDAESTARVVEVLAERDEALLSAYVDEEHLSPARLRRGLAAQTKQALVYPVFAGSAITAAGVEPLREAIPELLPTSGGDEDAEPAGLVFKIERGAAGERTAYVRMFSGTLRVRDRIRYGRDAEGKVTAISVFADGSDVQRPAVRAGEISKIRGLGEIQIGDRIGDAQARSMPHEFLRPTLEAVVEPTDPEDRHRLRIGLSQLAEQDPLIDVRQDDRRHELSISLYGEVQKEVIESTLALDYGIAAVFRETTPIYIERPLGVGEAAEVLYTESNPFQATIGMRVEPAPDASGIEVRVQVDPLAMPLYLYKTQDGFRERVTEYVRTALREGLYGWQVSDCVVTMTRCAYSVPDGPPSRRGPLSTAADFRKLTPIVVMRALAHAGTAVCAPLVLARVEVPVASAGAVLAALARLGAAFEQPALSTELATLDALLPAVRLQELQQQLPGLAGGEGVVESSFAGYGPVSGDPPRRRRTTASPLDLKEYLSELAGRGRADERG